MKTIMNAVAVAILSLCAWSAFAADQNFMIIVNAANPTTTIDAKVVANIFLKKTAFWPHNKIILPVDQDVESEVRRAFSEVILDRSVPAMRNYWQQLIFSGRGVPPPELESDRAVVDYVSRHADAIGYVSPQANVRQNKIVTIK